MTVAAVVALAVGLGGTIGRAHTPAPPVPSLPDAPQTLTTPAGRIRVVPIKGLVYPWGIVVLPNGDMLVTEQNRTTLRDYRCRVQPH